MKLFVLLFAACLAISGQAQDVQKHGGIQAQSLRIEKLNTGYLVALRALPISTGTQYLDITIRLGTFDATEGAHLAIGLGDLYRYYDTGTLPPVADGFVIGKSNLCPEKGVAVNMESYGGEVPGKILDCPTAFGPLRSDTVYQVRLSVTADGTTRLTVHTADDTLIWAATRSFNGKHGPHARGLFVIPYSPAGKVNGAYELLSITAGTDLS